MLIWPPPSHTTSLLKHFFFTTLFVFNWGKPFSQHFYTDLHVQFKSIKKCREKKKSIAFRWNKMTKKLVWEKKKEIHICKHFFQVKEVRNKKKLSILVRIRSMHFSLKDEKERFLFVCLFVSSSSSIGVVSLHSLIQFR